MNAFERLMATPLSPLESCLIILAGGVFGVIVGCILYLKFGGER